MTDIIIAANCSGVKNSVRLSLMEKLKSAIPETLKRTISRSNPDDLPSTCSSLIDFFLQLPLFHQMVKDLTDKETALCSKNKEAALELKANGNQCFSNCDFSSALRFYSQAAACDNLPNPTFLSAFHCPVKKALRVAPTDADDICKNLMAALYVNRAAALQKMGLLVECVRDCRRALIIYPGYAKAWYRRGKANAALGNYEDAICDLNICLELSSSGKKQIESELKLILDQRNEKNSPSDKIKGNDVVFSDQPLQLHVHLQCISTEMKGRGMVSLIDIPQGSLIHTEEPYAVIILKNFRETHCHFCLNELPTDTVPCASCSIPVYCSDLCQVQAGGQKFWNTAKDFDIQVNFSDDIRNHIRDVTRTDISGIHTEQSEHQHECEGVNWPAVLPSDVVLAGRILVKSTEQQMHLGELSSHYGNLDLCHNYIELGSDKKLEMHIYSIILVYCLQHSYGSVIKMNEVIVSQCVVCLAQIKVNSMAIVRIKSFDAAKPQSTSKTLSSAISNSTNSVEQVRVGQAIYSAGSLFNHSCQPNIHTYFLSRTLYIRSTEFVSAGHSLELSYGPQVGQWDCNDRQRFLGEQYSFICRCQGCSELNLSDLVINAFQCVKQNCSGVVLDTGVANYENQKVNIFLDGMQVDKFKKDDIKRTASLLLEKPVRVDDIEPGFCLNCGAYCDLEASKASVNKAEMHIRRLENAINSLEVPPNILADALRSIHVLKSVLHPYNKKIAQVEDSLAQALCLIGEMQQAREKCKASIEILEKLYGPTHIVIGNELVKLASMQISVGDSAAGESVNKVKSIFARYYGSHADDILPHGTFPWTEDFCKIPRKAVTFMD